jgi:N-methylhydantoinase B
MTVARTTVDPVKFEIFAHRLWAIGEEGRIALQQVSASPIVVQGGECMSSFYAADGTMVLACSGHLRFASATSSAIRQMIEWYGESPGFHEGDQIFFNDPYVAGSHTYDQMVVMPIFHDGKLVVWTASSSHTADVGGSLSGEPTTIFHEGIKIQGLKIVERGAFRLDVFRTLTEQCRDPMYVGLDLKSRIAANNVCARGFLELVEKFGADFVEAACQRLIDDGEEQARARLRSIPDGTWRSRQMVTTRDAVTNDAHVNEIHLEVTKSDDALHLSFEGSTDQVPNDFNSTLPSTLAHVHVALTSFLFWNVPWSDGKFRPVSIGVPLGSILNCRFPAACNRAPWVGQFVEAAVADCVARMLFAAGEYNDVNAGQFGYWYTGGPGFMYGGHNREGLPTAHGLYDIHGGGMGAAPHRDGVDSGGHMNIPSGGISDVERTEMQYPFLYFSRRHLRDGGGYGRQRGGAGTQRLLAIYGSGDVTTNYQPYGAIPQGAAGLFGGYGTGIGGSRVVYDNDDLRGRLGDGDYPVDPEDVANGGWGAERLPDSSARRIALGEYTIVSDFTQSGGGYGDPLDREPETVAADIQAGLLSQREAEAAYGVVLSSDGRVDAARTAEGRHRMLADRLRLGTPRRAGPDQPSRPLDEVLRIHDCLSIVRDGRGSWIQCRRCGTLLCDATQNYKLFALERRRELSEFAPPSPLGLDAALGVIDEYACPGCGVLLQVDVNVAGPAGAEPLWDIQIDMDRL